jgi:hypothetical protein
MITLYGSYSYRSTRVSTLELESYGWLHDLIVMLQAYDNVTNDWSRRAACYKDWNALCIPYLSC